MTKTPSLSLRLRVAAKATEWNSVKYLLSVLSSELFSDLSSLFDKDLMDSEVTRGR